MQRVRITLGVAAFGGAAGAVAGGISTFLVAAVIGGSASVWRNGGVFLIGAEIGAPLGALLLPLATWTLMRHVSFGKAFLGTVTGTMVGGFIGWFVMRDNDGLLRSLAGGLIGFSIAAILLRLRARAASVSGDDAAAGQSAE